MVYWRLETGDWSCLFLKNLTPGVRCYVPTLKIEFVGILYQANAYGTHDLQKRKCFRFRNHDSHDLRPILAALQKQKQNCSFAFAFEKLRPYRLQNSYFAKARFCRLQN